jgi:transcriptional regulator with XRE-family HTH domain
MKIVGVNIKRVREGQGINLRQFAKNVGLSASFISQVETGQASPSVATLKMIADELHTTVGNLIGEQQAAAVSPVMREADRKHLGQPGKGIDIYLLTSPDPNKQMEPLLFKLDRKATAGKAQYKHFGQEFVMAIKGAIELNLNDQVYVLHKGDSIYFNSNMPHSFKNIGKEKAEAIWVITPPTF